MNVRDKGRNQTKEKEASKRSKTKKLARVWARTT